MKKALVIMIGLVSFAATSVAQPLPVDFPRKNEIIGVSTIYPQHVSNVQEQLNFRGISLDLTFGLSGCVDKLGDVTFFAEETAEGKIKLHVSGQNIHMAGSRVVRCIVQATAIRTIELPYVVSAEDIEIAPLTVAKPSKNILPLPRPTIEPPMTCMAYWEGYEFDPAINDCRHQGTSGCSNPFQFQELGACRQAHGLN